MKRLNQLNIKRSLLSKLVLLVALFLGSSNAWGEDVSVVNGNTIESPWETAVIQMSYPSIGSKTIAFSTDNEEYLYPSGNYSWAYLHTTATISITEGQTFEIETCSNSGFSGYYGSPKIDIRYSTNKSTWTILNEFTNSQISTDGTFTKITTKAISAGAYYFEIYGQGVRIKSITIKDAEEILTPVLSVTPPSHNYGDVTENKVANFSIENIGTGSFGVTITKSGTDQNLFDITEGTVSGITGENSGDFTVTFKYDAVVSYGTKTATIIVTPDYEGGEAQNIVVTAYAKDPATWEDFSGGIPSSWYNQNNSWKTNQTGYSNKAYVTSSNNILRTPRLYAEEGQTLSYDVVIGGTGSSYKIQAQYSTDRLTWTNVAAAYTTSGTYTFTAPSTGYYWLQFTGLDSALDNFVGFGPAAPTHDMVISSSSISASGILYGDYTASVSVKERGGSGETVTAKLYFDGEEVAEKTGVSIGANRDATISVTFVPSTLTTGEVYLKIIYNGDVELTTSPQSVTISETSKVIDETLPELPEPRTTLSSGDVLKFKYTPKNGWSTICVPFGLANYMNQIFGTGWKLYELSSYSGGVLTFTKANTTAVSTPFLVYAENADPTIDTYYLRGVSLLNSYWNSSNINKEVTDPSTEAPATFKGTFVKIEAPNMNGKYGITSESKLAKGNNSASIKGFRAYLEVTGDTPARIMTIDSEGETTDLGFVRMVDQEAKDVYNLQGQKVEKGRKGIYIVNGKKVVIK